MPEDAPSLSEDAILGPAWQKYANDTIKSYSAKSWMRGHRCGVQDGMRFAIEMLQEWAGRYFVNHETELATELRKAAEELKHRQEKRAKEVVDD